jgi:hypothetical protein
MNERGFSFADRFRPRYVALHASAQHRRMKAANLK